MKSIFYILVGLLFNSALAMNPPVAPAHQAQVNIIVPGQPAALGAPAPANNAQQRTAVSAVAASHMNRSVIARGNNRG